MKFKANHPGVRVDEVLRELSDEAALALTEIINAIRNEPDNKKRNEHYLALTEQMPWLNFDFGQTVVLKNFSREAIRELMDIDIEISKKGRNGYTFSGSIISGYQYYTTEKGNTYSFVDWCGTVDENNIFTADIEHWDFEGMMREVIT